MDGIGRPCRSLDASLMHILSVIHYPIYGGPHNRNAAVIPELRGRGIETTVLLPDEPGNAEALLRQRGVDVVTLPLSRLRAVRDPRTHARVTRQFHTDIGRIRRLIRTLDIDVVLVNGLANPHSAIAAHLEGVPVVWQLLDTFAPMMLRRAMMPLVTALADVVMSTGRAVAEAHPSATKFGDRLVLFFPIADTALFTNSAQARRRARAQLGMPTDALVVGGVSNINPMKGHDTFVQAAAIVRAHRPLTRFVILGAQSNRHAEYTEGLWRTASELGLELFDPGADVVATAPALDVFWLTSNARSEGIPTVIGEAMSLELPIVASRVGSVHEAVTEGVTASLVRPRDPVALANATLPYLDDSRLRQRVGRAGRALAERLYSRATCADRHQQAFELALEHRRQRRRHRGQPGHRHSAEGL
jgi:glycosyltransferase involved in cell wall biosynthesis